MKIEVKEVSPVRRNMAVEAAEDEVAREKDEILKRYARQVRIPGFRPGRAPLAVVRARFSREVDDDLKERLVARLYAEAIKERGLQPLGDPVLGEVVFKSGEPFRFETSFEVAPEFTPRDYRGIEVRRPPTQVDDGDVERTLQELREAHTRFVTEDGRKAATGDVIVADVEGTPEGGESFRRERAVIEVGGPGNPPAFNAGLEGAASGSELQFSVSYPQGHETEELAARTVAYRLQVHEVKRRVLPELDDEFAKDLGEFADLEALKQRIRGDLTERKRAEGQRALRQSVLDKVLLGNPIPLPDGLVEQETLHRLEDIARAMVHQGVEPRTAEIDWSALRQKQEASARKAVHARLVLDAVARAESLDVEPGEVDARLASEARRMGETNTKLRARLEKQGGLEALKTQLVREKSLDFLVSVANIQGEE
jgi:trigger factor